jgi:hypothetical protein
VGAKVCDLAHIETQKCHKSHGEEDQVPTEQQSGERQDFRQAFGEWRGNVGEAGPGADVEEIVFVEGGVLLFFLVVARPGVRPQGVLIRTRLLLELLAAPMRG